MENILKYFKLDKDREDIETVISNIRDSVVFEGTNLWILIFAIFVASLGLNLNSTAVVIGAMLISPIMGPIMGIGLGIGINDTNLLRKSLSNFLFAVLVALATSTIFFLISPLNEAHSEILSRTSPTIYDVLIALLGGLAGIVATSSKQKGNVIPGVAIATALIPPLCTAGYGLATYQLTFFYGAFYLFIINTVFIAIATFVVVRIYRFPLKHQQNIKADKIANRLVWLVAVITILPSIYFGYDMVKQNRFTRNANRFITGEAHFKNDYLLNKKIDARSEKLTLIFGGDLISEKDIRELENKLGSYGLKNAALEVKQGFTYLSQLDRNPENEQQNEMSNMLATRDQKINSLYRELSLLRRQDSLKSQVVREIKMQYPAVKAATIDHFANQGAPPAKPDSTIIYLITSQRMTKVERIRLEEWLKIRLNDVHIKIMAP